MNVNQKLNEDFSKSMVKRRISQCKPIKSRKKSNFSPKKGNFKTEFKTHLGTFNQKLCAFVVSSEISAMEKNTISIAKYISELKIV